ncbi:bifunctional phosphoribosyl-AMP cyclohydrolase/phosphoribosyl-ATP diphosphatase HisIE [Thalassotalea aquiviva]|uniref:bifunctional phosphoribosyl-AMP cyclohydrolase/phosphoribosyl-ATP diphosphatase HisIE n=1 Tax=Thalassotalea aquiviva TaxID=3242415 RepID=UPI00352AD0D8
MIITKDNIETLAWEKMNNLLPAIIQHATTGAVLMQGYMNKEALELTLSAKKATFFSRSKQRLWRKGETSKNDLNVVEVLTDCDQDSLLVLSYPAGPTCHLGSHSCFAEESITTKNFLNYLEQVIEQRSKEKSDSSYTATLLAQGTARCAQKVGEEGVEVALAAATSQREELIGECADLFYHTLVLLKDQGVELSEIMAKLQQRHK